MNKSIDWYFDFISPFAYFQHRDLINQHSDVKIRYYPVLLGALFLHNQHKGPAEIPAKRMITYRYCVWYAKQHQIPFKFPDVHPYRPINVLRMAIAAGVNAETVSKIFEFIWVKGKSPDQSEHLNELAACLGLIDYESAITKPEVKEELRKNTEQAVELGIFGVPTVSIDDHLFWGHDQTPLILEYLDNPDLFKNQDYLRIANIRDGLKD
ncbi:MAG: 2-hydroxychromene-2-carboxylate isomerase [Gammaproteobacteria bacterium]|nr:2-hydroxychromene-2-carboxylate isomerase [Gammaproteobacteria bacterium]MCY4217730.1 2-hydroxychromene-2-carboxylate isomerase [Gammaproteobacteria bacterium]MCY4274610.1 2-hydroxychromene-2-carboxylate isomerase [Gammaproteobacteria bacterium]